MTFTRRLRGTPNVTSVIVPHPHLCPWGVSQKEKFRGEVCKSSLNLITTPSPCWELFFFETRPFIVLFYENINWALPKCVSLKSLSRNVEIGFCDFFPSKWKDPVCCG